MGRSTTSCFKIISCGGNDESVDRDDIDASSEKKDKRGWSFRKRSARHRVLSNTVITTEPPLETKTSSEPVTVTSEPQVINSSISEKTCDSIWTEESTPQLTNSVTKDADVSTVDTITNPSCEESDDIIKSEPVVDESAILVIQAAVRRFLAQRELVRHKKAVKLQAAVRGHLVRNHAVGTLRCVQAIVKMQALVRARRADVSADVAQPTYISIEKLLSNSLARQLLESRPKTKQINVKCVPSKSDSAWNWLERWMSASSPETVELESHAPEQNQDQEKFTNTGIEVETVIPDCEPMELESNAADGKEDSVNTEEKSNERNLEEENPQPTINTNTNTQKPENILEESMELTVEKTVSETEPKRVTKRVATEEADSEGRKSVFGSRKPINPSFIAAQSRFEELTSKTNNQSKPSHLPKQENDDLTPEDITPSELPKPVDNTSNQDNDAADQLKPFANSSKQENDDITPEDITPSDPSEPVNKDNDVILSVTPEEYLVSECGTELSITSTLDSPDLSEVETKKLPEDSKIPNEEINDTNGDENNNNIEDHKNGPSEADIEIELEPNSDSGHQIPEPSSPRSQITAPESHGTPNSQLSTTTTNTKKSNKKSTSSQKRKSWSTSKKSTVDSGLRTSLENLPKEPKAGKRRNSFGSPRPDNSDHEGNGNGVLPSYMQATESARAKAIANGSPRSSPDVVQDKEIHLKKRHSLPGGVNGRQGSPRIQRSMSQALEQPTKGNGSQERKWQR